MEKLNNEWLASYFKTSIIQLNNLSNLLNLPFIIVPLSRKDDPDGKKFNEFFKGEIKDASEEFRG